MKKIISKCPACQGDMQVSALQCKDCGLEIRTTVEPSPFEMLSEVQQSFMMTFLRFRGNMKSLQEAQNISYPTAKKRLDEVLASLGLGEDGARGENAVADMAAFSPDCTSTKASEIIKCKLKACGGKATIYTATGLPCKIWVGADGVSMISDKLPIKPPYGFDVFDAIVDLLLAQGGTARKGNGRNFKLGQPQCDDTTVVGYIAAHYHGKEAGSSVFDPVFILAAVLEWAGIAHNGRGEISLTANYRAKL